MNVSVPAPPRRCGASRPVVGRRPWLAAAGLLGAVLATTLAARLAFPLPGAAAPQTAQTLAVLLAGVVLGPSRGALGLGLYLLLGALGLPLFADGAAGAARLTGPTGGFLLGFPPAAAVAGWWRRSGRCAGLAAAIAGMLLAHATILTAGWIRLGLAIGAAEAFASGIRPFLLGAALKSLGAAALALAIVRRSAPAGAGSPG
jgi:biotin transport system substrate-specific component